MKNNRAIEIMTAGALVIAGALMLIPTKPAQDARSVALAVHENFVEQNFEKRSNTYKALLTPRLLKIVLDHPQGCSMGNVYSAPDMCTPLYDPLLCNFRGKPLSFAHVEGDIYEAQYAPTSKTEGGKIRYRIISDGGRLRLDGTSCVIDYKVFW